MARVMALIIASGLAFATAAWARSPFHPPTAGFPAQTAFAFQSGASLTHGRPGIEQRLIIGPARNLYLYAGASSAERALRDDARWLPSGEAQSRNALVNTRFGIGWQNGEVQTSVGYLRRELPDLQRNLGDRPPRDSMLGLSVSFQPKF